MVFLSYRETCITKCQLRAAIISLNWVFDTELKFPLLKPQLKIAGYLTVDCDVSS